MLATTACNLVLVTKDTAKLERLEVTPYWVSVVVISYIVLCFSVNLLECFGKQKS